MSQELHCDDEVSALLCCFAEHNFMPHLFALLFLFRHQLQLGERPGPPDPQLVSGTQSQFSALEEYFVLFDLPGDGYQLELG